MVRRAIVIGIFALAVAWPHTGLAQTTTVYHLHKEASLINSANKQLKTIGPDGTQATFQSVNLKNMAGNFAVAIAKFETQTGVPGLAGTIASGSAVSFSLRMRVTSLPNSGSNTYAQAVVRLNNATGTQLCTAGGQDGTVTPLTTSLAWYNFSCTTSSAVAMTTSDRFFLEVNIWLAGVMGNNNKFGEIAVETNADSTVTIPKPAPNITSVNPTSGIVADAVTISGTAFGTSGTVTFNGATASTTSWNATTIQTSVPATVPPGAGPVVVTVNGLPSNGKTFTAVPHITTLNPSSAAIGQSVTITGTTFGTSQGSGSVTFNGTPVTNVTSWTNTSIAVVVPSGATSGPVIVTAGGTQSNSAAFTLLTKGTLSGTITRATGGAAISGATVQAVLTGVVKATATSAANGSYSISDLDPGTYDVRVSASGFSPEVRSASISAGVTTPVNVAMLQPGSISGTVTQASGGAPIVGAAVALYLGPAQKASVSTDANGNYSAANLHPGAYTVQASNAGNRTKEQGATIVENANTTSNLALDPAATGSVQYVYDELNRLVSVIDPAGDAAHYTYDAVGNLLSIARAGASAVSIGEFTPNTGPIGSSVTIYGTGFSTSSSNTVTFGAGQTTATAATPNRLTVTVPAGATTAQIGVSNTSGSATSNAAFTVTAAAPGVPTITGFTPSITAGGATVTVNGTNFDTVAANDRLSLNATFASVATASATSLTTVVPATTTSGPITVATPNGSVTTATDLFVAPAPHVATDVEVSQRIALGDSRTVTINTAGHIGLYTFAGLHGQRISLLGTNGATGFVLGCDVNASIQMPSGGSLGVSPVTCMEQIGFVDGTVLPADGFYTVYIEPVSPTTGNIVTFTLYNVGADLTGSITADGSALTVSNSTPGQNISRTFTGTAGQRLSVLGTNGMTGQVSLLCDVYVSLRAANGTEIGFPACMEGFGFIDTVTLPSAGTYSVFVDPQAWATGSITLNLYTVPADFTGTIAPGTPVTVPITTPGQNGSLTFSATAGQRISLAGTNGMTGQVGLACDVNVSILKPDGSVLAPAVCMEGSGFIEPLTVPADGTYTVFVDPQSWAVGNLTLQLYNVADTNGTIVIGGDPVVVSISTPGQNHTLTFSGTAGQRISLNGTNASGFNTDFGCQLNVTILKPDTTVLAGPTCMETGGFIDATTLPVTGTYSITIDPAGGNTGTLTLQLYGVTDTSGPIVIGGGAVVVAISTPGQNHTLTFSGTSGQRISLNGTNGTGFNTDFGCQLNVTILKPDTTVLAGPTCMETSGFIDATALPTTGTYTITVDPAGPNTGSLTLTLYGVTDTTGSTTINGGGVGVSIGTPGQNHTLTFSGTSSQVVSVHGTNGTGFNTDFGCQLDVTLKKPDGTTLAGPTCMETSGDINSVTLPTTGTYTILIDPLGPNTGSLTISVTSP